MRRRDTSVTVQVRHRRKARKQAALARAKVDAAKLVQRVVRGHWARGEYGVRVAEREETRPQMDASNVIKASALRCLYRAAYRAAMFELARQAQRLAMGELGDAEARTALWAGGGWGGENRKWAAGRGGGVPSVCEYACVHRCTRARIQREPYA